MDVAVNCINALPQLLRCDSTLKRNWIKFKLVGVKSNRSGIGSRVTVTAKTTPDAAKPLQQMGETAHKWRVTFRRTICACTLDWSRLPKSISLK